MAHPPIRCGRPGRDGEPGARATRRVGAPVGRPHVINGWAGQARNESPLLYCCCPRASSSAADLPDVRGSNSLYFSRFYFVSAKSFNVRQNVVHLFIKLACKLLSGAI